MTTPTGWTSDPDVGGSNNSIEFCRIAAEIERLIREDAHNLIAGRADATARLVLAQLAHVHRMRPEPKSDDHGR